MVSQHQHAVSASRTFNLDVLRGIAILGTLGTNIWVFSGGNGNLPPGTTVPDMLRSVGFGIEQVFAILSNGKFLSLLSILFGVGLAMQYESALRRGEAWPGRYLWRSTLLFLEGLLHFTLIFEFDVLMGYALTGVIVAFLLRAGTRAMWWGGGIAAAVHLIAMVGMAVWTAAVEPMNPADSVRNPKAYADLLMPTGYLEQVGYRLTNFLELRTEAFGMIPYTTVLFLLGVLLYRNHVFAADERAAGLRSTLLRWGLGLGLPLNLVPELLSLYPDVPLALQSGISIAGRYGFSAVLALGYLGLTLWIVERGYLIWWCRQLSYVGRTALSSYIGQNLIASILFYAWGFRLGGELESWQVALVYVGMCSGLILLARIWIATMGRGPVELLRKHLERIGEPRPRDRMETNTPS